MSDMTVENTPYEASMGDYFALLKPRVMSLVVFTALGGEARRAGLAPVEVPLQVARGQCEAGRTAVDNTSQGRAVAFAKAGDGEKLSKCIT